jgi:hypothetical protein
MSANTPELNVEDLIGGGRRQDSMDVVELFDLITTDEIQVYHADAVYIRHAYRTAGPDPARGVAIDNSGLSGPRGQGIRVVRTAPPQAQQELIAHVKKYAAMGAYVSEKEWNLVMQREQFMFLILGISISMLVLFFY